MSSQKNKTQSTINVLHIPTSGVNEGGITRFITNTMGELTQLDDINCHIVSPSSVQDSLINRVRELDITLNILTGRTKNPLKYLVNLVRYMKKHQFDIVHVHGSSALMSVELFAAKLAGIPIRIAHSHNITCEHQKLHKLLSLPFHHLYTHTLACSKQAGEWLFSNRSFTVVYNGIDLNQFAFSKAHRHSIRQQLGLDAAQMLVGHIGHFNQQKNHTFLIDIFNEIMRLQDNARLLLIGSGELEQVIKQKVKNLQLTDKVFFLGNVSDPYRYFSAMDTFVLPSLFEGFSIVLAESQANGLVSFTSSTTPITVKTTSKLTYLPLQSEARTWAEAILKQQNNHDLTNEERQQLAIFDIHAIANQLGAYYESTLNKTRK